MNEFAAVALRAAIPRVPKRSGDPIDYRLVEAVHRAKDIAATVKLHGAAVVEIASVIVGYELSPDAYKRAAKHVRRKSS